MDTEPPSGIFLDLFLAYSVSPAWIIVSCIFLVFLLIASALISGSEIAFFSLTSNDTVELEDEKNTVSKTILSLLRNPGKLLATILITNNLVNIAIVILSTYVLNVILPITAYQGIVIFLQENLGLQFIEAPTLSTFINLLITVVAVTFLLVLFGEVAPKIYANFNNIRFARIMAKPLYFLNKLFGPFSNILVRWTNILEKKLGDQNSKGSSLKEDIDQAIELTINQHSNEENEADILRGIINFSDLTVRQIMTPRTDVVGYDKANSFTDLISLIKDSGFSRIPIYEEDFDKVIGILYVKDLIGFLDAEPDFDWTKLIRDEVLYAPESKKVNELLRDIQTRRMHMAIVIDEYGGSSGIVTLEDIMEEVVGDIRDEFDEEENVEYVKMDDNNFIFDGKTHLQDVCKITGIDNTVFERAKGESDTLAGLMLEILGLIPKTDREITVGNIRLKVVSVNKKRIEKISINIP